MSVLTAFDIFNPDSLDKIKSCVNTLINHYGNSLTVSHENDTVTADLIINQELK